MSYLITSGWWCSESNLDNRLNLLGDDTIRGADFHSLWNEAVRATGTRSPIYIIDSCSPVKPRLHEGEMLISLEQNFGHSTRCSTRWAGVTRAHLLGMMLTVLNEYDYWVYIEQDALVYGDDIIEKCITSLAKPMAFGDGSGTPYPMQQSFMIIKAQHIPKFIERLDRIKSSDNLISPELKFCIATSPILSVIPEAIYRFIERRGHLNKLIRMIIYSAIRIFRGFDYLPFGYGRRRPIDFEKDHFYFQHCTKEEIAIFKSKLDDKRSMKLQSGLAEQGGIKSQMNHP